MATEPEIWQSLPEEWERGIDIPMEARIWQALPQDLLLMILARLPMRVLPKMRTVSNRWKNLLSQPDAPRRISLNYSVHSIPGFLVQLEWATEHIAETLVIEYLRGDSLDMKIYKAPLPYDVIIVDACKSIYCCHRREDNLDFSIGNLATRSRRRLPRPHHLRGWSFIAMNFDATSRRCTVVLGQSSIAVGQLAENRMVIEIYDSESNAWTMVSMTVPRFIYPIGKGIYSKGKVYWIIYMDGKHRVMEFTIADGRWAQIGWPRCVSGPKHYELGGCDGRVVLMVYHLTQPCIRMWKLKEGPGTPDWCEPNRIWMPDGPKFSRVGANSSGWTMMFDGDLKISLCNPKRRLKRSITLPLLSTSPEPSRIFVSDFESNNVSWP